MLKTLLVSTLLATSLNIHAASVSSFSDDFEGEAIQYGYNGNEQILDNWDVTSGSVDVVNLSGSANTGPHECLTGNCIDLDGSSAKAGTIETKDSFEVGTYKLSFDLSGNGNRTWSHQDTVTVSFGDYLESFTLKNYTTWASFSAIVNVTGVNEKLRFAHTGGDNAGVLLDNVSVSAVPVPAAAFLFAPALLGFMGLRRKAKK